MKVLALNNAYVPIRIVSKYDAIGKLYCGVAEAIVVEDGNYLSFDFDGWMERSLLDAWPEDQDFIGTTRQRLAVPRIIRYFSYSKVPRVTLRLSKRAIFNRDGHVCYVCGNKFSDGLLSLDHVQPISKGGKNTWENLVTCCKKCNEKKGSKTWGELNYKPKYLPHRPKGVSNAEKLRMQTKEIYPEWGLFGL